MSIQELTTTRRDHGNTLHHAWLRATLMPPAGSANVLVGAYIELHGDPGEAVRALNQATQGFYPRKVLHDWRRRTVPAPEHVKDAMRRAVLESRFGPELAGAIINLLDIGTVRSKKRG